MAWTKHFKSVNTGGQLSPLSGISSGAAPSIKNYLSRLPDVYIGHPNRIERYNQYEQMDADSEVNAALDILAEFATQKNEDNNTAFTVHYHETPTDNEIKIIKEQLIQWCNLNEFEKRMFRMFRNVLKYGDQVFVRDPETHKLLWSEMSKVTKVIVNESDGKTPEQYFLKDIAPNLEILTVTAFTTSDSNAAYPQIGGGGATQYNSPSTGGAGGSRFSRSLNEGVINAEHVVHISLSEGLDSSWPFGTSVLETIFKVFKQKELLEDAILIYRIQRAPERRIFKIDVGNMPTHLAMAFVERIKNEAHQRRIPTQGGNGGSMMDATFNPLSTNEDYFFPQTEGRGSSVEALPGGSNLGEITDLRFFTNKMFRGLRIPSSYLPTQTDDSPAPFTDGKVGIAMIQEWRFNQYCLRLQGLVVPALDQEFKLFMKFRGINIDSSLFNLKFNEPQNFTSYRQADIDLSRVSVFSQLEQLPYMSKRFMMTRYLGMTEDERQENEKMWAEEHGETDIATPDDPNIRNVGVSAGALGSDLDNTMPPEEGTEGDMAPEGGMPGGEDMGAGAMPAGATPPAP